MTKLYFTNEASGKRRKSLALCQEWGKEFLEAVVDICSQPRFYVCAPWARHALTDESSYINKVFIFVGTKFYPLVVKSREFY